MEKYGNGGIDDDNNELNYMMHNVACDCASCSPANVTVSPNPAKVTLVFDFDQLGRLIILPIMYERENIHWKSRTPYVKWKPYMLRTIADLSQKYHIIIAIKLTQIPTYVMRGYRPTIETIVAADIIAAAEYNIDGWLAPKPSIDVAVITDKLERPRSWNVSPVLLYHYGAAIWRDLYTQPLRDKTASYGPVVFVGPAEPWSRMRAAAYNLGAPFIAMGKYGLAWPVPKLPPFSRYNILTDVNLLIGPQPDYIALLSEVAAAGNNRRWIKEETSADAKIMAKQIEEAAAKLKMSDVAEITRGLPNPAKLHAVIIYGTSISYQTQWVKTHLPSFNIHCFRRTTGYGFYINVTNSTGKVAVLVMSNAYTADNISRILDILWRSGRSAVVVIKFDFGRPCDIIGRASTAGMLAQQQPSMINCHLLTFDDIQPCAVETSDGPTIIINNICAETMKTAKMQQALSLALIPTDYNIEPIVERSSRKSIDYTARMNNIICAEARRRRKRHFCNMTLRQYELTRRHYCRQWQRNQERQRRRRRWQQQRMRQRQQQRGAATLNGKK